MARSKEFDFEEKLEAARNLFWEKGYHATSMQDLETTLQLNRSSIYDTYGNKHALFIECLQHYIKMKREEYIAAGNSADSPLEAVKNMIRNAVKSILEVGNACMVVKSSFELAHTDAEIRQILRKQVRNTVKLVSTLLQQAKDAGEIPAGKDPELVAQFLLASLSGLWKTDVVLNDKKLVYKMTEYLIDTIAR